MSHVLPLWSQTTAAEQELESSQAEVRQVQRDMQALREEHDRTKRSLLAAEEANQGLLNNVAALGMEVDKLQLELQDLEKVCLCHFQPIELV